MYGPTRSEVVEKLAALRRSQERGLELLAAPRTLATWLDEWLTDLKPHHAVRPTTLARYRSVVNAHLRPGLGRHRLDKLAPSDVQRLQNWLHRRPKSRPAQEPSRRTRRSAAVSEVVVETRGLEPLTPALQRRCSAS